MSGMLPCAWRWIRGPATSTTLGATSRLMSRPSSAHASSRMPSWPRCSVSVTTTVSTASTSSAWPRSDSVPRTGTARSLAWNRSFGAATRSGTHTPTTRKPDEASSRESQGHRLGASDAADDQHSGQVFALEALAEHPRTPGPTLQEEQRRADSEGESEKSAREVPLDQQGHDRYPAEQGEGRACNCLILPRPGVECLWVTRAEDRQGDHPADEDRDVDQQGHCGKISLEYRRRDGE